MRIIYLSQQRFALVDDEDYDYLNQWKWHANYNRCTRSFYAVRNFTKSKGHRTMLRMHRILLNISDPKIEIDHIDHNTLNNQRSNLRIATHSQSMANRNSFRLSESKYLGVTINYSNNKWRARTNKDKKEFFLGIFDTQEEAAVAYDKAAISIHGEFANLNFKTKTI